MRRKFRVRVGEKTFDVEVEEVTEAKSMIDTGGPPSASVPSVTSPIVAPRTEPAATYAAEGRFVRAPLPGRVLAVRVRVGDLVKAGDTVLVLESMKMENEIVAPRSGVVRKIHVAEQASVNYGDNLVEIE